MRSSDPSTASATPTLDADTYDIVVVGGALAGASLALLLRRWRPATRILVVEGEERFERKVGEATVEVSSAFLHRVLGLHDHLSRQHLSKHGLRFWFSDGGDRRLDEMTEIGPGVCPEIPSFQLDRSTLDEHVLSLAGAAGVEVARPGKVTAVELGWPQSTVTIDRGDGAPRRVRCRWVIDASGRHAFLARRLRLRSRVEEHPTAAAWSRWYGVADLDGREVLGDDLRHPRLPTVHVSRRLATNHFCGYGWWCWVIPLADGATSVGVVWDKRHFDLPDAGDGSREERYRRFVTSRPGLRELLAAATPDSGDFHSLSHLPYRTSRYADRGWALVGDAAAFLDPFYSPGLDHLAITVYSTALLLERELSGSLDEAELGAALTTHDAALRDSYSRWLEALYLDKYELMGDAEILAASYLVDTASYYLGVVTPVYRDLENLRHPMFGPPVPASRISHFLMASFKRRLVRLARARRQAGTYGRRNLGWHSYSRSFGLATGALPHLCRGLGLWLRLEVELLGLRLRHPRLDLSRPVPAARAATPAPSVG